jgi:hypothetical protein
MAYNLGFYIVYMIYYRPAMEGAQSVETSISLESLFFL